MNAGEIAASNNASKTAKVTNSVLGFLALPITLSVGFAYAALQQTGENYVLIGVGSVVYVAILMVVYRYSKPKDRWLRIAITFLATAAGLVAEFYIGLTVLTNAGWAYLGLALVVPAVIVALYKYSRSGKPALR
jgi:hypothetical protein